MICEPQRFGALSRTIYQAERPLVLTFIQGIDRDKAFLAAEDERRAKQSVSMNGNCCKTPELDVLDPAMDHPGTCGAWANRPRSGSNESEISIDGDVGSPGAISGGNGQGQTREELGLFFLCNSVACDDTQPPREGDSSFCFAPKEATRGAYHTGSTQVGVHDHVISFECFAIERCHGRHVSTLLRELKDES